MNISGMVSVWRHTAMILIGFTAIAASAEFTTLAYDRTPQTSRNAALSHDNPWSVSGMSVSKSAPQQLPAASRISENFNAHSINSRNVQNPFTAAPPITTGQPFTITRPNARSGDAFGSAMAFSGDTLAIAASGYLGQQGKVYIYNRNEGGNGKWGLVVSLSNPASGFLDNFGSSLALSGDTLLVGACGSSNDQGMAYVFNRNQNGAEAWGLVSSLSDPASSAGDKFGCSVAADGDTLLIGAKGTPDISNSQGKAYVYNRNQGGLGNWGLTTTLAGPVPASNDEFGVSVAVDGDMLVVGADLAANKQGAAYVYQRIQGNTAVWELTATIKSPLANTEIGFGTSLAVHGYTIVIGTPVDSNQHGAAYVFEGSQGGFWKLTARLASPTVNQFDNFGGVLALNGDVIAVGALGTDFHKGKTYLFKRNQGAAGTWSLIADLADPAATSEDAFGSTVAINGDTLIVGSNGTGSSTGVAYAYNLGGGDFGVISDTLSATDGVYVGGSMSVDGNTLVVGAQFSNDFRGNVYVYSRNRHADGAWSLTATVADPDGLGNDYFGSAVRVSGDTMAVASITNNTGAPPKVRVFYRNKGGNDHWGWVKTLVEAASASYGYSLSLQGDILVVGAPSTKHGGRVYMYGRNQGGADHWGLLTQLNDIDAVNLDSFGFSVSLDGDTLIVGAVAADRGHGKAYIFSRNQGGEGMWGLVTTLPNPADASIYDFGTSVSVNGDTAVVGTNVENGNHVYVYRRNQGAAGAWGLTATLTDPAAQPKSQFGRNVVINGDTILVGAIGTNNDHGAAYAFRRNTGGPGAWGLATSLFDPTNAYLDAFGFSIAIDGDTLLIGSPGANDVQGAAYIYSQISGLPSVNISPSPLKFAGQTLGSSSQTQIATIANLGSGALNMRRLNIQGNNATDFSIAGNDCNSAVAPGGHCSIQIVFTPTGSTYGNRYASLTFNSNAPEGSSKLTIVGTATPAIPTGLTASKGSRAGKVILQWNATQGATSYRVYEGTSPGGEGVPIIKNLQSPAYTVYGLTSGQTYYFKVAAVANNIASAKSVEVNVIAP